MSESVEEIALEEKTSPVEVKRETSPGDVNGSEVADVRSNPEGRSNAGNGNGDTTQVYVGRSCSMLTLARLWNMDTLARSPTHSLARTHARTHRKDLQTRALSRNAFVR